MTDLFSSVRRFGIHFAIGGLLSGTAVSAGAVVFTTDYDRLTVLPALTAGGGDVDWRTKGAVTPVKNEGMCDSSWAFAVTGLIEAYHQIQAGQLISLSEQELVDCTGLGSGCGGGSPIAALRTVVRKGGLTKESSYPYTAREGMCKTVVPVATIPGAGRVPPGDEVSLQGYVARGPVLALVNASPEFDSYRSGIFNGPCSVDNPTQAVLIVGYAAGSGGYWLVKNSIGTSWGSQGYIFMARGVNLCGIANYAIAISNDPLPPPLPSPAPTLSAWTLGLLVLVFAALGFLTLRSHTD